MKIFRITCEEGFLLNWVGRGFTHSYFSQREKKYTSLGNHNGAHCLCEKEMCMLKPQYTAATMCGVLSVVFVSMNVVERMCASACMCVKARMSFAWLWRRAYEHVCVQPEGREEMSIYSFYSPRLMWKSQ